MRLFRVFRYSHRLMTNFRRPYFAASIREFWQRWHISLSTWFRDYFYIPLGGNRVKKWRMYYNLFATFLVSGLWHGANWTFVIWGALHGFYMVFAIWTRTLRDRINKIFGLPKVPLLQKLLQILITFVLVYFSWIFFRANSLSDAVLFIKGTFHFSNQTAINVYRIPSEFYIAIIGIIVLIGVEILQEITNLSEKLAKLPLLLKWILLLLLIFVIFVFGVWEGVDFLYFQF